MTDRNETPQQTGMVHKVGSPSDNRRAFLKKVAITAPLVTTLSSRSVWAAGNNCSLTGTLSGNQSVHMNKGGMDAWCSTSMPQSSVNWAMNPGTWPSDLVLMPALDPNTTTFVQVFASEPLLGGGKTLLDVLIDDGMASELDTEIVAAYLNALSGLYPNGIDRDRVISSYQSALMMGSQAELLKILRYLFNPLP